MFRATDTLTSASSWPPSATEERKQRVLTHGTPSVTRSDNSLIAAGLKHLLGLEADGFAGRLRVARPLLPEGVDRLELDGLPAGKGRVSLRFTRTANAASAVEVLESGEIEVVVEPVGTQQPGS